MAVLWCCLLFFCDSVHSNSRAVMKLNGTLLSWYSCPCYTCHLISVCVRVDCRFGSLGWTDRRSGGVSGGEGLCLVCAYSYLVG